MRRTTALAAVIAAAVAVPLSIGSSHREAPNISNDPAADNTDTYAWTAADAPGALTLAANWIPGQNPSGFGDPKLNVVQRYSIVRETHRYRGKRVKTREKTIARALPAAPSDIGPKTFPNYAAFTNAAIRKLKGGIKVFAGQRDDPFFVDLGATFDGINVRKGTGNAGEGKDDLSGMNVSSIVMQIPERLVTKNHRAVSGPKASNAVVGVWSTTERRKLEVTNSARKGRGRFVQVSRLGNPLINEVVIPLGKKDKFNRTTPNRDAALYGKYAVKPELAAVFNALFGVNAPENNRTDIVQALLQGIPGLNQHKGIKGPPAVDTIKLNLGTPPASGPGDRFGVIGGDTAGYPNGRRLGDDVVDIDLQVVAGFLKGNKVPLGDGVDQNDKPFLSAFPYLAAPTSGFDSDPSNRVEPGHPAIPAGGH